MAWSERGHRQQCWPRVGLCLELVGQVALRDHEFGVEHHHPFWELLVPVRGSFSLSTAHGVCAVPADSVALVPPMMVHAVRATEESGCEMVYLGVSTSGLGMGPHVVLVPERSRAVDALQQAVMQANAALAEDRQPDWLLVLSQIQVLAPSLGMVPDHRMPGDRDLVAGVIAYLERNRHRPVTVREIAAACYRSPGYIGELFAAATGQTIKRYHRGLRLDEAARRLRCPGATVTGVAADLGYSSSQVLSREFKEWFGFSPSARTLS